MQQAVESVDADPEPIEIEQGVAAGQAVRRGLALVQRRRARVGDAGADQAEPQRREIGRLARGAFGGGERRGQRRG
ncbi:hypothetical protein [Burkholderia gladioli]|uniref:hypothetical protein n=1 Tax=Burkholderia gladioli TaxID=28095 RepID=UPI0021B40856|nr:hypothetical protein [Burkholderia gladioli]